MDGWFDGWLVGLEWIERMGLVNLTRLFLNSSARLGNVFGALLSGTTLLAAQLSHQ